MSVFQSFKRGFSIARGIYDAQALVEAAWRGDRKLVEKIYDTNKGLLNARHEGWTAFMRACSVGEVECADWLWQQGAQLEAANPQGMTALHWAAVGGRVETITFLVDKGHPVDLQNNDGWTSLMLAVKYGHYTSAVVLVQHANARLDIVNNAGDVAYDISDGSERWYELLTVEESEDERASIARAERASMARAVNEKTSAPKKASTKGKSPKSKSRRSSGPKHQSKPSESELSFSQGFSDTLTKAGVEPPESFAHSDSDSSDQDDDVSD